MSYQCEGDTSVKIGIDCNLTEYLPCLNFDNLKPIAMCQALNLIQTKEILTNEEREIVLAYDKAMDFKYLTNIGQGRWLNINVYSEAEHHERIHKMEMGV